jgi:hypothetical protein
MRCLLVILFALGAQAAWAEDIVDVLERSQQVRLDALEPAPADSPRAQAVRASFDMLVRALDLRQPAGQSEVELRVTRGGALAETLRGHVVIANEVIGDWAETDRLFVLAHELGHVRLGHWSQMGLMFQKWVPGMVTPQQTNAVAALLGRDASVLSYQQEFEADAFAAQTLQAMGLSQQDVISVFMHLGVNMDTATHPGTQRRIASLRAGGIKLPAASEPSQNEQR